MPRRPRPRFAGPIAGFVELIARRGGRPLHTGLDGLVAVFRPTRIGGQLLWLLRCEDEIDVQADVDGSVWKCPMRGSLSSLPRHRRRRCLRRFAKKRCARCFLRRPGRLVRSPSARPHHQRQNAVLHKADQKRAVRPGQLPHRQPTSKRQCPRSRTLWIQWPSVVRLSTCVGALPSAREKWQGSDIQVRRLENAKSVLAIPERRLN